MNKKAGLSLGINTIIVLVIAMVVIAAGITFIRTFFDAGTDRLLGAFDIGEFGNKPDRLNPLVLERGTIRGKANSEVVVRVGFYNTDASTKLVNISLGDCTSTLPFTLTSLTQSVEGLSATGFGTLLQLPGTDGTYICTIQAWEHDADPPATTPLATTQVEVQVTN